MSDESKKEIEREGGGVLSSHDAKSHAQGRSYTTIDHEFKVISPRHSEGLVGIYAIYQRLTSQIYVGSSIDIGLRLQRHMSDLQRGAHHSEKLQMKWKDTKGGSFIFLLIEEVADITRLRAREQFWIDRLDAYGKGFNSRSVADGPEPSLEFHIDRAIKIQWPRIYERFAPNTALLRVTDDDRASLKLDLRKKIPRKAKQLAISSILFLIGVYAPEWRFLWVALIFYFVPVILFDWPNSAQSRARDRYHSAVIAARLLADEELIKLLSVKLGTPEKTIRDAFNDAPRIVAKREASREKFRRDPMLRLRAKLNRIRQGHGDLRIQKKDKRY